MDIKGYTIFWAMVAIALVVNGNYWLTRYYSLLKEYVIEKRRELDLKYGK